MENRRLLKPITIEEIVIFMIRPVIEDVIIKLLLLFSLHASQNGGKRLLVRQISNLYARGRLCFRCTLHSYLLYICLFSWFDYQPLQMVPSVSGIAARH